MYRKHVIFTILALLLWFATSAQSVTRVRGRITDSATGDPLPFVTVTFTGTTIGTTTDKEGMYSLETRAEVESISAYFLSYETATSPVNRGSFNHIDITMNQVVGQIDAVIIRPGANPAHAILDSISANKYRNDPDKKQSYRYRAYSKMEIDAANLTEFKNKRMQRNFGFVFEHLDTSAMTGRAYLPVMISETVSDFYHSKNPSVNREVVTASRISGLNDYNFAQFTGATYVDVNPYQNFIDILGVNVPSPLAEFGRGFYNYYLIDSTSIDSRKTYYIRFHPKSVASPVFDGEINIDAQDWALRSARMRLAKGVNVNWLRDVFIETHSEMLADSSWFKKQDRIIADFSFVSADSSRTMSFMVQRQIDYSDIEVNRPLPDKILKKGTKVLNTRTAFVDDDEYWAGVRPYELSAKEQNIYAMVDSVKQAPLFRSIYDIINTIVVGYQKLGPVEVGTLYRLYSFNALEGSRFELGIRTNKDFSRRVRLSTYGAYGLRDHELKGGGSVEFLFGRDRFSKLTLMGKHDVLQLGAGRDLFAHGNILSSVFSRGDTKRLLMVNEFKLHHEQEWTSNVVNTFTLEWREVLPTRYVGFTLPDGSSVSRLCSTEASVGTRLSYEEGVHRKPFERIPTVTKYPVVDIELTAGLKDVFGGDYNYYRTVLNTKYKFHIPPVGRSNLSVTAGKIFGRVPYPLLKIHEGNATYFYDNTAFSCMNFYEFASDMWVSVMYEHQFRGFFLGRIPLLRRLQWREVFVAKALWGSLSSKNDGSHPGHSAVMNFPEGMSSVSTPYVEIGAGIENIFRIFRVTGVWRLTHRTNRQSNFAINISMYLDF